jgi:hypothetical protein
VLALKKDGLVNPYKSKAIVVPAGHPLGHGELISVQTSLGVRNTNLQERVDIETSYLQVGPLEGL